MEEAFAGIDVACAKRKRLPIVVCTRRAGALVPLTLRGEGLPVPPRGMGNALTINEGVVDEFAEATAVYLHEVEERFRVKIARVAIDAPSDPRIPGAARREAELELDRRGINCFTTPDPKAFELIAQKVGRHLVAGSPHNRIPHANQLWMLVGFALFRSLRPSWHCMETFPQAIAHALNQASLHKGTAEGLTCQLAAASLRTGWPEPCLTAALRPAGFGSPHDLLDAYLAAWVASLSDDELEPLGHPPDDVIWIPRRSAA